MKDALFIGIDIGTQGTKAMLCDITGKVLSEAFCASRLIRPDTVTVYEEPQDILNSVMTVISEITARMGEQSCNIRAIGMDAQMAGIMGIDEDFNASTPLDSWLDSRCKDYTALLEREAGEESIESSGGQVIHAHAPKILWWKNEQSEAYSKTRKFVMPNGFVAGKLCGLKANEAFMDYTFLHFNSFSDNRRLCFNEKLLALFKVDKDKLPRIVSPEEVVGTVTREYAQKCGLPNGVQVIAGCGDTAASSLGAGITRAGLAYDVAGTASVFACATKSFAPDTKQRTILFSRSVCKDLFLPLAYISGGGLCLKWYSRLCGQSLVSLDQAALGASFEDTPIFLPHFSGRTCPLDNRVSGAFLNISPKSESAEMYTAIMESIAYEYKSYLDILRDNSCLCDGTTVIGVGGGAKSTVFSQIKADVLGLPYMTPEKADSAPCAMALLAAHGTGERTEPLNELFRPDAKGAQYLPDTTKTNRYAQKAQEYLRLLNGYGEYIS